MSHTVSPTPSNIYFNGNDSPVNKSTVKTKGQNGIFALAIQPSAPTIVTPIQTSINCFSVLILTECGGNSILKNQFTFRSNKILLRGHK